LFAQSLIKSTILTIANPQEVGDLVSLEVISSSGKLTARLESGKPILGIEIKATGNIGEEQGSADLTDENDIEILEKEAQTLIACNIKDMLVASQTTFDCDILDFNDMLYKHDYSNFEKIKDNWNALYRSADIGVQVQFEISRTGIIKKPAYSN
ncbi:MAG: Ger(x)C family spore germination C-terminal domain-containing protein, partial [Clostridia bacterium]|nr:Ger(x)C family spore germination C-terminal domain-containing protein [Clostridia bacterium]